MLQYLNNVALKINAKLGGINQSVRNRWLEQNPAIIIGMRSSTFDQAGSPANATSGADVSHPSPGSLAPSIAAVTMSRSENQYIDYTASVTVQHPRNEIIGELDNIVVVRILSSHTRHWLDFVPVSPEYVQKSKDGAPTETDRSFSRWRVGGAVPISDAVRSWSTYQYVSRSFSHSFLPLLNTCFPSETFEIFPPHQRPLITFVVVGKRHHVRFFPNQSRQPGIDDRSGNFHSGLVVDSDVVHPIFKDFYLQSQRPLQGTSRPAHYTVLYDANEISLDQWVIIRLLCF